MSVRFASANHPARRLGWRAAGRGLVAPALARAVNDNADGAAAAAGGFDPMLAEALRHFAVHGLASTKAALEEAQAASARGDGDAKDHWLGVAAMFDRRARVRFEPA